MNRRNFLKTGAAVGAAALLPQALLAGFSKFQNQKRFPQPLMPEKDGEVKVFRLFVDIYRHDILPGFSYHTLAFNNQVPGPEIRVNRGDRVRVIFQNNTELNHTIHWHGLHVPWRMDGVPYVTQMPVMSGKEFVYEFEAQP